MRSFNPLLLLMFACGPVTAPAQLAIAAGIEPQPIFPGTAKSISVIFHNPNNQSLECEIRTRVFQATSATAVLLSEKPWKILRALPGQTVVESTPLDFPTVKAETKFIVQWLEGTNRIIGQKQVLVYPTNLLEELKPMAGSVPVGLFDPQNQVKPLLQKLKLEFTDLELSDLENFSGKLAIVGPFQSKAQIRNGLGSQIQALAKKNTAIVWYQPPSEKGDKLSSSFYSVPQQQIAVVVAQAEFAVDLAENPQAQLHLIYFCRLALNPQPLALPDLSRAP